MTRARDHRTTEPTASASSYPRYRKPYALFMEYLVAGLDVYEDEPHVPQELLELDNAVLLPHVASASVPTRRAMGQLVVDNLAAWFATGRALTPVRAPVG